MLGREHIRFFYTLNGNRAVMLHVFAKKSQRIPAQDISLARNRLRAFVNT
ncbi:MAG: type II toxin-antitoxin system RelE/ParE family toxin [Patescibacteria group bacterium]